MKAEVCVADTLPALLALIDSRHMKEEDLIIQVQKKDGTLDEFNRDKINRALTMACRKRQVTIDQIETLITGLEAELRSEGIRIASSQQIR